jgi:hypothetical protein
MNLDSGLATLIPWYPLLFCVRGLVMLGLACNGFNLAEKRGGGAQFFGMPVWGFKLVYQGTTGTATGAVSEIFVWVLISS